MQGQIGGRLLRLIELLREEDGRVLNMRRFCAGVSRAGKLTGGFL